MISVTPVILAHQKRSDGTYVVKMRITYNRQTRYMPTNIIAQPGEVRKPSSKNKSVLKFCSNRLEARSFDLKRSIDDAVSKIPMQNLESMTVDDIISAVKGIMSPPETFRLDFIGFGYEQAMLKSPGSRKNYESLLSALKRYIKSDSLDISMITTRFLRGFQSFIENEPRVTTNPKTGEYRVSLERKGERAVSLYLSAFRHLFNLARREYNDPDLGIMRIPVSPFEYYSVPRQNPPRHRFVTKEVIQRMINDSPHLSGRRKMAVDSFLLSFGLFGMNAIDMYTCKKEKDGILVYNRSKTKARRSDYAEMRVRIEPEILPLVEGLKGKSDLMFRYSEAYGSVSSFNSALNKGLKEWKPDDVDELTFYSARHSWATIARSKDVNIDKHLVNEGLAHVDESMRVTDIYAAVDWEVLWDANRKVLSLFDWSPLKMAHDSHSHTPLR